MNILFFLTPKEHVSFISEDENLQQVFESMELQGYTAVPLLSRTGKYIGTVTEGDLLWALKEKGFPDQTKREAIRIVSVKRRRDNQPVYVQANMEDLLQKVTNQNFVPVVDDEGIFIGIVTRKDVILYYARKAAAKEKSMSCSSVEDKGNVIENIGNEGKE